MKKKKKGNRKNTKRWQQYMKQPQFWMVAIMVVLSLYFVYQIWDLNVLPLKDFLPIVALLILFDFALWWLQYGKNISKLNRNLGKGLLVILCLVLGVGNVYAYQARAALGKVNSDDEYEFISVVVEKDSPAEKIEDVKDGTFAITQTMDRENTQKTILDINEEVDQSIHTEAYDNLDACADALYDKTVDAMILNEAYRSLLDENHPSFNEDTRVIYTFKIKKKVTNLGSKVNVTEEPFNVYISGIDTYGPIATKSRSDVNMIATINPQTRQILLTSIPRDYYVAQTCQANEQDKLTHTGIFGIDCTLSTMEQFTGLTMNYYARVNFSSLEDIVDAIGGIDVYNEIGFNSGVDGTLIPAGNVHMDGSTALKFSRERHAYADGDRQRGRNQMIVLSAIIDKATSPAIITGYSSIMNTVGDTFQSNMDSDEMMSLIKMQLNEGGSWHITSQSVDGNGANGIWSPANQSYSYMMYPDMDSVNAALLEIQKVMDGAILK